MKFTSPRFRAWVLVGVLLPGAGAQAADFDGLDFSMRVPDTFSMPERSVVDGAPTVSFRSGRDGDADAVIVRVAVSRSKGAAEVDSDGASMLAADKQLNQALAALKKQYKNLQSEALEDATLPTGVRGRRVHWSAQHKTRAPSGWLYAVARTGKLYTIRLETADAWPPAADAARAAIDKMHFR